MYVAIGIFLFSTNSLLHRILMKDVEADPYAQTLAFYGIGGIVALIIAISRRNFQYQLSHEQLPYFALMAIFCTLAPILAFRAYREVEASEATVLFSSQRLWMVFGSFLVLQETFHLKKVIGTLVILSGITFSLWRKQKYVINRGVIYALLVAFSYAVADVASFFILRDFDAPSLSVYVCFIPVATLLVLRPVALKKLTYYLKPKYAAAITAVSFNDTLASLAVYFAYQVGRNSAQISPLMATQIILSVILAIIFLKERDHMAKNLIGAIVVVAGVLLII